MNLKQLIKNPALLFLLLGVGLVCAGCSTTGDAENASSKPWNSPEGWQSGAFGGYMNQGQHR